jgi:phosphopantothenoylcysteine decarboxylase/phosphopantothenate--cysteine ligase
MGFALGEEAAARGADVTVVAANVSLERNPKINYVNVSTAAELEQAVHTAFPETDALVMAAAVADFRPVDPADGKIKKAGREELEIHLTATNDVLAGLKQVRKPSQVVVGFAAEAGPELLAEAERKLESKGLDMIVANDIADPSIGFEVDGNEVTIITKGGAPEHPPRGTKHEIARAIVDRIEVLIRSAERGARV